MIVEESLIKQIDEIAGEKTRRAATIETALREFISRQARKAKAAPAPAPTAPVAKTPVRGTTASAAKSAARSSAAPAAKTVARAKR